uniref:HFM1, ATP-dependent DNA helicase homolog n=1 Tax=Mus musculus TaxID=10090 RepID=D6RJK3_MOUSE
MPKSDDCFFSMDNLFFSSPDETENKNDAATGSFCTRLLGELDCRGEKTSSPELVLLL